MSRWLEKMKSDREVLVVRKICPQSKTVTLAHHDPRYLMALNRKERNQLHALEAFSKKETRMIDLKRLVEATSEDDTTIYINPEKKELPPLFRLVIDGLAKWHQADQNMATKEAKKKGLLLKRVDAAVKADGKIELTEDEITLITERIWMFFKPQPRLALRAEELLRDASDPGATAAPQADDAAK